MNRKKLIRQCKNARKQLPLVSQWSVRFPGHTGISHRDPRELVESEVAGIGVLNGLSDEARGELRFISAHNVGPPSDWWSHTVIRFEVGETAAAELQKVIGQSKGGQILIGATSARVQYRQRRDITAKTKISFKLQSLKRLIAGASTGLQWPASAP